MTKQFGIAVVLMSTWALLGAYETIPSPICFTGLIAFIIGILLALWESRDERRGKQ